MDKYSVIVFLSISIIVVFGATDPQEQNKPKNDDTRIFIRLEPYERMEICGKIIRFFFS